MDGYLIESRRRRRGTGLLGGAASFAIHTSIILALVYATLSARQGDAPLQYDTTLVLLAPEAEHATPAPPALNLRVQGFQTVTIPEVIPAVLPQIELQQHFDPRDFTGIGTEGGVAHGISPAPGEVLSESMVDEIPLLLAAPTPEYPSLLRQAGIGGRVTLQAVLDTTGRVEPGSIRLLEAPAPGFERSSRQWMLKAVFRPARLRGRAVRVMVRVPLDYTLTSGAASGG